MADDLLQQLNNLTPEQLTALIQQAGTIQKQKEAAVSLRQQLNLASTDSTELAQTVAMLKTQLGELDVQILALQVQEAELIGIFEG
jgi:hypothetical protein